MLWYVLWLNLNSILVISGFGVVVMVGMVLYWWVSVFVLLISFLVIWMYGLECCYCCWLNLLLVCISLILL